MKPRKNASKVVTRTKRTTKKSSVVKVSVRRYDAAKIDRLTADWMSGPLSANEEIRGAVEVIRNRARELEQNSCHARRYLSMVESNVVGRGFTLRIEGNESVVEKFNRWFDQADVSGRLSAADQQRLVARTTARDGEVLARKLRGPQYMDGLALQYLESDYIDHRKCEQPRNGANAVVMGVEVSPGGKPVSFYLFDGHPGETTSINISRVRVVSASDVIHVARIERPGQTRAVSWMASVMRALRMLAGYQESELVAARVAASKMGFYKIPPGEDYTADGTDAATGAPLSDAAPGHFERLPTGWEVQTFDPSHPNGNYTPFTKGILREIAGGLTVAYNNFANDLDGVSYSSIRSGTIEERQEWRVKQDWFARAFLNQVFDAWREMAAITGTITATEAEQVEGRDVWTGRTWPWVDPQSDITAKKMEIELGLTTPSIIAAEMSGGEYGAIQERMKSDNEKRIENDLIPVSQSTSKQAVQDTALNGAQITSAVQIIQAAAAGQIPVATVGPLLKAAFPSLDDAEIKSITAPLKNFEPTPAAGP